MGKFVISVRQFTILSTFFAVGTAILIIPAGMAQVAKQDAWIAAIMGVAITLLLGKLYIAVGNLAPNMSFVEVLEKVFGKWVGVFVSVSFLFFTFLSAAELVYFVGNFMQTSIMPETPPAAFHILYIFLVVFGTYLGLETFARSAEILFPFFILLFVLFVIFISFQIDVHNIQPVFETETKPLIRSVLQFISVFAFPMVVLLMIFPVSINDQPGMIKGLYIGIIAGGLILIVIIALCILVIGADSTAHHTFPSYVLAKRIAIGNFVERIEAIMAFMWIITIFFRTLIYFYVTVVGIAQLLKLKDYRLITLPLGMILVALSLIVHPNIVHSNNYNEYTWIVYASIYGLFLPLLILGIAKIRKPFKQKVANPNASATPEMKQENDN